MQVAAAYSNSIHPHTDSHAYVPSYSIAFTNTGKENRTVPIVTTVAVHALIIFGLAMSTGIIPAIKPEPKTTVVTLPPPVVTPTQTMPMDPVPVSLTYPLDPIPVPRDFIIEQDPPVIVVNKSTGTGDVGGVVNTEPTPHTSIARVLRSTEPPYPLLSKIREEEGVVMVRIAITATGTVSDVALERSSGFPKLDEAALNAVREWRFAPAKRGTESVASTVLVPVKFRLSRAH